MEAPFSQIANLCTTTFRHVIRKITNLKREKEEPISTTHGDSNRTGKARNKWKLFYRFSGDIEGSLPLLWVIPNRQVLSGVPFMQHDLFGGRQCTDVPSSFIIRKERSLNHFFRLFVDNSDVSGGSTQEGRKGCISVLSRWFSNNEIIG